MRTRRVLTLVCVGLLTAALATPALAGRGSRGGSGGQGQTVRTQTQLRLRDGSGQQAQAGFIAQNRARSQSGAQDGTAAGARLRDGSCLTAPTPAPEATAE